MWYNNHQVVFMLSMVGVIGTITLLPQKIISHCTCTTWFITRHFPTWCGQWSLHTSIKGEGIIAIHELLTPVRVRNKVAKHSLVIRDHIVPERRIIPLIVQDNACNSLLFIFLHNTWYKITLSSLYIFRQHQRAHRNTILRSSFFYFIFNWYPSYSVLEPQ